MMFNKKVLGSCCVGLALLLFNDGFGAEPAKKYTVVDNDKSVVITEAEIQDGVKKFSELKNVEELKDEYTSYWEMFISAYLIAQKDINVGNITKETTVEDVFKQDRRELFSILETIDGAFDIYDDIYNASINTAGEEKVKPSPKGNTENVSSEEVISLEYRGDTEDYDDAEHMPVFFGDDDDLKGAAKKKSKNPIFDKNATNEELANAYEKILQEHNKNKDQFKLSDEEKELLGDEDEVYKKLLDDEFCGIYAILKYLDGYYTEVQGSERAESFLKLRGGYISKLKDLAEMRAALVESENKSSQEKKALEGKVKKLEAELQTKQEQMKNIVGEIVDANDANPIVQFTLNRKFKLSGKNNFGIFDIKDGKLIFIDPAKILLANVDMYGVYRRGKQAAVNKEDAETIKKIKNNTLFIAEKKYEEDVQHLAAGGHEVVESARVAAMHAYDVLQATIDALKSNDYTVLVVNANAAPFGLTKGVQEAAQHEVETINADVKKVAVIFGIVKDDLSTDDIKVLNAAKAKALTGDWNFEDNFDGVQNEALKDALNELKNIAENAVPNLVTAGFGRFGVVEITPEFVKTKLLILELAGKTVEEIQNSIAN